ncbi:hypothetical protein EF847_03440 [Actinobacteria bacterium YIM 96077]|uniref:Type 2A encapsulin shell protein SrpI-like domain-containing protein n=1 Tax=Phytoactinopolyspora halophila TaxID=1981511 RepID=A0A329R2W2_9ACTN|nr:hypothetical protein EF847_03440 [Actinobacteria bacterium YIM 96077]RAW18984.1 hypothetical protein DPM12_02070 [Phytoactinopolyspora halophila]
MLSTDAVTGDGHAPSGLSPDAARTLATTTKSAPYMPSITSRWLLRRLPWVEATGGTYRRNQTVTAPDGREIDIDIVAGQLDGAPTPAAFVDYDPDPPEHDLHAAQTILRVPSRIADLYNGPYNQIEQQILLIIQALRERQEYEMVNNGDIGLLHVATPEHRLAAHDGTTLLDDLDELLGRRRNPHMLLAHPKAIVALGQECTRRGLTVEFVDVDGDRVPAWRGVPVFPCSKIPITERRSTSVIVLRTGEEDQGVIGLHQTGLPDEWEPSLNVRFMGIDHHGVIHYLISAYYSLDVLVPDALGVLDNIPLGT